MDANFATYIGMQSMFIGSSLQQYIHPHKCLVPQAKEHDANHVPNVFGKTGAQRSIQVAKINPTRVHTHMGENMLVTTDPVSIDGRSCCAICTSRIMYCCKRKLCGFLNWYLPPTDSQLNILRLLTTQAASSKDLMSLNAGRDSWIC